MKNLIFLAILSLTLTACTPTQTKPVKPVNNNYGQVDGGVACTMEAKICPDGTAVGRSGPNCEFAPCPGEVAK